MRVSELSAVLGKSVVRTSKIWGMLGAVHILEPKNGSGMQTLDPIFESGVRCEGNQLSWITFGVSTQYMVSNEIYLDAMVVDG